MQDGNVVTVLSFIGSACLGVGLKWYGDRPSSAAKESHVLCTLATSCRKAMEGCTTFSVVPPYKVVHLLA